MTYETGCAGVSGASCVVGISLSTINLYLTCASLLVSLVAGLLAIRSHYRGRDK